MGAAAVLFFIGMAIGSNSEDEAAAPPPDVVTETTVKTTPVPQARLAALSEQRAKLAAREKRLDARARHLTEREKDFVARATAPPASPPPAPPSQSASCDPNYTGCVPNVPYDLDCADVGHSVQVIGGDPHGFDGDGDGSGCETY